MYTNAGERYGSEIFEEASISQGEWSYSSSPGAKKSAIPRAMGLMRLVLVTWHTGNPPPTVPGTQDLASSKSNKVRISSYIGLCISCVSRLSGFTGEWLQVPYRHPRLWMAKLLVKEHFICILLLQFSLLK